MPLTEILKGEDVAADLDNMEPLSKEQKEQITELFKDMEIVHEHLVCSCSTLGNPSRSLSSWQLLLLLKMSIRLLVQLNVTPGLFDELVRTQQRMELPKDLHM